MNVCKHCMEEIVLEGGRWATLAGATKCYENIIGPDYYDPTGTHGYPGAHERKSAGMTINEAIKELLLFREVYGRNGNPNPGDIEIRAVCGDLEGDEPVRYFEAYGLIEFQDSDPDVDAYAVFMLEDIGELES